jgi:DNA-binding GntR family transcriptional regulator
VAQVHDLYEVRMALELQALRRPAELGLTHDLDELELLRDEWQVLSDKQPDPDPGFVTRDEDFHVRLAAASGNPSLADLLRIVNERIRVVRMHDFLTGERVQRTVAQHLEIVDAVLDGDLALAIDRFARHLGESMAVVEQRSAHALARMASGQGAMRA